MGIKGYKEYSLITEKVNASNDISARNSDLEKTKEIIAIGKAANILESLSAEITVFSFLFLLML